MDLVLTFKIVTGFYNDHHFHYGYHIYAAAAVAHFDYAWGRQHFDQVLLLIRDIANPSDDDIYFPKCRQKVRYEHQLPIN
jgi:endo-1,3(4)-beta-glucanase